MASFNRNAARERLHRRIRKKVSGTAARPRLSIYFSGKHVYAQVIDDDAGKTLIAASTAEKSVLGKINRQPIARAPKLSVKQLRSARAGKRLKTSCSIAAGFNIRAK